MLPIQLGITAAYHPSADGQSEKINRIVETALCCWIASNESKYFKWTTSLPIVEHEYNPIPHTITGESPNSLQYVLNPKGIPDILNPYSGKSLSGANDNAELWAEDLKNRRDEARGLSNLHYPIESICRQAPKYTVLSLLFN